MDANSYTDAYST